MALADSAVHMMGADYLISHGQDYSHLDVRNSYGAFLDAYYNTSYPSGADTMFGASAMLLRLPLIWAFQPFNAFMLALVTGPAWVLARRIGLERAWAATAVLTITLPAIVYAYELIGSVKEIVALALIMSLGALLVSHKRWLWMGARGAIPFALTIAAGVSTLGLAFGAWALIVTLVLMIVAIAALAKGARSARSLLGPSALAALVLLVGAWPTWSRLSQSLHVAQAIALTSNPGNLRSPLRPTQLLGVWLGGSYKLVPTGVALTLTYVLGALVLFAALVGLGNVVRSRWYALAAWFASMIALWLALGKYATTWADAKTLMLTSPIVMLMAWAGVAALRGTGGLARGMIAALVASVLLGGVLASDAFQYNRANLAPTARYEELAALDSRFAGRGPTLFTDFDEYALYELRDMDVAGPNFAYPPPALAAAAGGYGRPVDLDRVAPKALVGYPLIVTRRDPSAQRPPAAYKLRWQGSYYQVWARMPAARPALLHTSLAGAPSARCARIVRLGRRARSHGARLVAALEPRLVVVSIPRLRRHRPVGWARARAGILMRTPGSLQIAFKLPSRGVWQVWLKADLMRELRVWIDGRLLGSLGGQLGGNSLIPNTLSPLRVRLSRGEHTLALTRLGASLAPGDGGAALLTAIFLTPSTRAGEPRLVNVSPVDARSLCGRSVQWLELVPKS
jgi:hypothetical protein